MSRDYDDDRPRGSSGGQMGPLDKMYRDTNTVLIVIFSICCNGIALILGLIAMFTAKDPQAKSKATLSVIIAGILAAIGILVNVLGVAGGLAGGAR